MERDEYVARFEACLRSQGYSNSMIEDAVESAKWWWDRSAHSVHATLNPEEDAHQYSCGYDCGLES